MSAGAPDERRAEQHVQPGGQARQVGRGRWRGLQPPDPERVDDYQQPSHQGDTGRQGYSSCQDKESRSSQIAEEKVQTEKQEASKCQAEQETA